MEKSGDRANYLDFSAIGKLSVWTSVKVSEYYNEVEQEDENLHKEGSLCRTYAHIGTESRLKTTFGGFRLGTEKKQCIWWCAACGGQYDWKAPNRVLVVQDSRDRRDEKCFERTLHRKECVTTCSMRSSSW